MESCVLRNGECFMEWKALSVLINGKWKVSWGMGSGKFFEVRKDLKVVSWVCINVDVGKDLGHLEL